MKDKTEDTVEVQILKAQAQITALKTQMRAELSELDIHYLKALRPNEGPVPADIEEKDAAIRSFYRGEVQRLLIEIENLQIR